MIGELFDPKAELLINDRLRPHWAQAGAIVFVTMRTKDSIPREVIRRWELEKQQWIERELDHGVIRDEFSDQGVIRDHEGVHYSQLLPSLSDKQRHDFYRHFNRCRETKLDECLGACILKQASFAKIVVDSLLFLDADRYRMGDFVVMPNHVHMLVAFSNPEAMERQFASWMRFTATKINRQLMLSGHFWQQEPFDHLVRSSEQYTYLCEYIADNPRKAGLKVGEYYYRKYAE